MRPLYDDFDEFTFDDVGAIRRILAVRILKNPLYER